MDKSVHKPKPGAPAAGKPAGSTKQSPAPKAPVSPAAKPKQKA